MKTEDIIRAIVGFTLFLLVTPVLLFLSAGTLRWPMAWVYVVLTLAAATGSRLIVLKRNPDTLRERARFTTAKGTKSWDRILAPLIALIGPWVMMVVAGLDRRYGWSASVPIAGQYGAAFLLFGGYALAVWAMVVNRYFSAVARIQEDRGQEVVTSGPYQFVRHPSYAGGLLGYLALPVMLETLWAFIPALLILVALVIRTKLEDDMLITELEGYAAYVTRTRHRLMPGIW
jgi:protein-S-isoprenylcysteine O-methyltransferase Ste14